MRFSKELLIVIYLALFTISATMVRLLDISVPPNVVIISASIAIILGVYVVVRMIRKTTRQVIISGIEKGGGKKIILGLIKTLLFDRTKVDV